MKKNKGFSLVELIVVVAIMAVLIGILVPALVMHANRSKRSTDVNSASEIVNSINRIMNSDNDLFYQYSGDNPSNYTYCWNKSTTIDSTKSDKLINALFNDLGTVPFSKWDGSLYWRLNYNGETGKLHIYLVESPDSTKGYELYPEYETYVKKNDKSDVVY